MKLPISTDKIKQLLHFHRYTTIEVKNIYESEKTILVEFKEQNAWLRKDQITIRKEAYDSMIISIPDWLFEKKFKQKWH